MTHILAGHSPEPSRLARRLARSGYPAAVAGTFALALVAFFWKLGDGPIRQWDEASMAVGAFEMLRSGELLAKTMDGALDFTNTKPPLATWLVAASMQLFGPTAFALRLPSALAGFATVAGVWAFARYHLKGPWTAIAAAVVLTTSIGFTSEHVARGGDYDSLLVFFLAAFALAAFVYAEEGRPAALWIGAGALALALLTKGIAGLLPVPGVLLYFLARAKARQRLLRPQTVLAGLLAIAPLAVVYLLTERAQPGYLAAVNANELFGRFGQVVGDGTPRGPLYYLDSLARYRFWPWMFLLPLAFFSRHPFAKFALAYTAAYLLVISASQTKFHWYDAPLYPVAALAVGMLLARMVGGLTVKDETGWTAAVALGALLAIPAYRNVGVEIVRYEALWRENDLRLAYTAQATADILPRAHALTPPGAPIRLLNGDRYNTPLLFAKDVFEAQSRRPLLLDWRTAYAGAPLQAGFVLSCYPDWTSRLRAAPHVQVRLVEGDCALLNTTGEDSP